MLKLRTDPGQRITCFTYFAKKSPWQAAQI